MENQPVPGICGLCGQKCVLGMDVRDGRIAGVEPWRREGWPLRRPCVRGAALKQYVHHADRIDAQMCRVGHKYVVRKWSEVLPEIAERLLDVRARRGAEAAVFYAGHPKWFRQVYAALAAGYGSPNYCTESSTCNSAMVMAWKSFAGANLPPDKAGCRVYLLWSENLAGGTGDAREVRALRARGAKVITVDPRVTAAAADADLHLQPIPGTDGALALGIACAMLEEGLEDREYLIKYCSGVEAFCDYARQFPPARAAALTGVPAERIRAAAHLLHGGGVSLRTSSCAAVHCVNGVQNLRAVLALLALSGSVGRPGGNGESGAPEVKLENGHHALVDRPQPGRDLSHGEFPAWDALVRNEAQCVRIADRLEAGEVGALVMFGMNTRMWPDAERVRRALGRAEVRVVSELFWNEACEGADYVLPACAAPERGDIVSAPGGRLIYVPPALPAGERLPDVEIILRLAHAMGLREGLLGLEDHEAWLDHTLRRTGVSLAELKSAPEGVIAREKVCVPRTDPDAGFATPDGKLQLASPLLAGCGADALPVFHDWRERAPLGPAFPLVLCTGARRTQLFHSRTYRVPWLADKEPAPLVTLNPAELARLGAAEGEALRLVTPCGAITVYAEADPGVLPGVAHVYHGVPGEENVNAVLDGGWLDPVSGFPGYRSYVCRLEKIEGGEGA